MQPCISEGGKHSPSVFNYDPRSRVEQVGWDACKRVTGHATVIMIERVMDTARPCGDETTSGICAVTSGWL